MIPQIILSKRTPQWLVRVKIAIQCAIGAWKYTKGIHFMAGDTLNIHHRFFIVSKHYD